jgi:adenylyltransferase/sulfurtransferase
VPNCADAGVLGVLPGVIGTIQATEVIKLIVGAGTTLCGRLVVYDALDLALREFAFRRRAECAVCGDHPTITAPTDGPPGACDAATLQARVRRLRPAELRTLLESQGRRSHAAESATPVTIVDVREPREFVAGHLHGAINIPVVELGARIGELPRGTEPIFVCRSGSRSFTACGIALRHGVERAINLEGGLLAWAEEVDPGIEVAPAR